jgi:hypothetical protein
MKFFRGKMTDLELKDLNHFRGTEQYYNYMGLKLTDGVHYIMENGYSWLVSDATVILKMRPEVHNENFVVINLKLLPGSRAKVTYEDGDYNLLYEQYYEWTDAKREIKLFFVGNVLMLAGEY